MVVLIGLRDIKKKKKFKYYTYIHETAEVAILKYGYVIFFFLIII